MQKNKLITIYLNKEDIPEDKIEEVAFTIGTLFKYIKEDRKDIHTTQTHVFHPVFYDLHDNGFDIKVVSKGKSILASELLGDVDGNKSFGREIRPTQNWEKMLYSGCFDLEMEEYNNVDNNLCK